MAKSVTHTLDLERETKGTFLFRDPENRKRMHYLLKDDAKAMGKMPEDAQLEITFKWAKGE